MCIQSLGQEKPWSRKWQATPVFLPRKFHGQRSLVGYSHGIANSQTGLNTHREMKPPMLLLLWQRETI